MHLHERDHRGTHDRESPVAGGPQELRDLTPARLVAELDRYIIGQKAAKKLVAIAIRNRWRRQQIPLPMRDEVSPHNIIMIGPTGVGKTEIARRLAQLVLAPFLKVEASKYTEVGYHGRDVESMIRDLVGVAFNMVRKEHQADIEERARAQVEEALLDLLLPGDAVEHLRGSEEEDLDDDDRRELARHRRSRERMRRQLRQGKLEDRVVTLTISERPEHVVEVFGAAGMEQVGLDMAEMLEKVIPTRRTEKVVTVAEARVHLYKEHVESLIDKDKVGAEAVRRVEETGIVFIDEIDKIASREEGHGPDVSRQGVQRDLLPIVEGTTVITRYGMVRTDHILFICAGAFHITKPSDIIPELQGRFPIRVELEKLGKADFVRILTEPENALVHQYRALLATEGIDIEFTSDSIEEVASIADRVNQKTQNIGARRLQTVMEKLLEDVLFEAPEKSRERVVVDREMVRTRLEEILVDDDLSRYVL